MKLREYQDLAIQFELMDREGELLASNPSYVAKILGLVGEAGEVAEKYKKIIRDKGGKISEQDRVEMKKELGDVLWYVAALASYLDLSLEEVAEHNIAKLTDRRERGVSRGEGDNR